MRNTQFSVFKGSLLHRRAGVRDENNLLLVLEVGLGDDPPSNPPGDGSRRRRTPNFDERLRLPFLLQGEGPEEREQERNEEEGAEGKETAGANIIVETTTTSSRSRRLPDVLEL